MPKLCECGTIMLALPNEGNVWACQNQDCDCTEPIKTCVKCNRILHAPLLRANEDERCACCCDLMGHDETPDGKLIDWDNVPCCPECGSFDVRLLANVKVEGWAKFNAETGEMETRPAGEAVDGTEEFIDGEDLGGYCDSCDAQWKAGMGCHGGDWEGCRPLFRASIVGQKPVFATIEMRARGKLDAVEIFQDIVKQINDGKHATDWEYDDSDPYNAEITEILDDATDDVVWTPPDPPEVKDGTFSQIPFDGGIIRAHGEGENVELMILTDLGSGHKADQLTITKEMLLAIDLVRTKR